MLGHALDAHVGRSDLRETDPLRRTDWIMKRQHLSNLKTHAILLANSSRAVRLPFKLLRRIVARAIQVVFALFVVVLHPQFKWLVGVIAQSSLVQKYVKPGLQTVITNVYEPY